jgi:hypothetical protein
MVDIDHEAGILLLELWSQLDKYSNSEEARGVRVHLFLQSDHGLELDECKTHLSYVFIRSL